MPFQRLDLLPDAHRVERTNLVTRWESSEGARSAKLVKKRIQQGAGKYFLEGDLGDGKISILRDDDDLAGIDFNSEHYIFDPADDTFKYIDFSYSTWYWSSMRNASFFQCRVNFARFHRVTFEDCIFCFTSFYGCSFERCIFKNCDFVDENGFTNCKFGEVSIFNGCFFNKNKFVDCCFDLTCDVLRLKCPGYLGLRSRAIRCQEYLPVTNAAGIFQGIKNNFLAGEAYRQARRYSLLQSMAFTRFNIKCPIQLYFWEYLSGYGLRPARVLFWYIVAFLVPFAWFAIRLHNAKDAAILAAGAVLTFGAKSNLLDELNSVDVGIYVAFAFAGVSLLSLLITVVATKILSEG